MSKRKEQDTLQQLKHLLEEDMKKSGSRGGNRVYARHNLMGAVIRVLVSIILFLFLYLVNLIDRPIIVSLGIACVILIEAFRIILMQGRRKQES